MDSPSAILTIAGRSLSSWFVQCASSASSGQHVILSIDDITSGEGEYLLNASNQKGKQLLKNDQVLLLPTRTNYKKKKPNEPKVVVVVVVAEAAESICYCVLCCCCPPILDTGATALFFFFFFSLTKPQKT